MSAVRSDPFAGRDLRAITADGVYFSIMVGLGESYIATFALAVGLGDIVAGLLASVPMLLGAILQLVTPFAVRRLGSYRRWVVACATLQGLSFAPLAIGAVVGGIHLYWVVFATVLYWAAGMSAGPAWNAWITSLVPVEIRARFFARRTRAGQVALFGGLLVGGLGLEAGRRHDAELPVFALLFAGALAARLVSARYLASQSEMLERSRGHRTLGLAGVWGKLRGTSSLRVLRYLLIMQVATYIAAPYFTPYMLSHLKLSYSEYMMLTAAAFLARALVLPVLGRIAARRGATRLLWLGGLGIVPLPALWLVSDALVYLFFVQLAAGFAWAAVELATTLAFFEEIAEEDRAGVLTAFNFANACALALGAVIGAEVMTVLAGSPSLYAWLFAISTAGRLVAAAFLRVTPAPHHIPQSPQMRTLAVGPSGATVQRPILASLEPPPPEDAAAAEREPRSERD